MANFSDKTNSVVLSWIRTPDLSVTSQCSNWQVLSSNPTWGKILSHVLKIANFYYCAVMLSYFFSLFWRRNQKSVNHLVHWDPELGFFSVCVQMCNDYKKQFGRQVMQFIGQIQKMQQNLGWKQTKNLLLSTCVTISTVMV